MSSFRPNVALLDILMSLKSALVGDERPAQSIFTLFEELN